MDREALDGLNRGELLNLLPRQVARNMLVFLLLSSGMYLGTDVVGQKVNLIAHAATPSASGSWDRWVIDNTSGGADGARFADANKDGLLDIATGWEKNDNVRVYLNPGAARVKSPWPHIRIGRIPAVEDAFFADVDKDGAMDVVTSAEAPRNRITLFFGPKNREDYSNPEAWRKEGLEPSKNLMQWMYGAAVQLDGKHGLDILAGGKMGDAEIGWFEAPRNPRHTLDWDYHTIGKVGWTMSLEPTDMDGDGDVDVLVTDREAGAEWFENPGRGTVQKLPWRVRYIAGKEYSTNFLTQADVDKDGLMDVVTASGLDGIIYSRRLSRNGRSWENFHIETGITGVPATVGVKGLAVADINMDGRNDIAFGGFEEIEGMTGVFWLSYRNSPEDSHWDAHEIETMSTGKFDLVSLLDLDDDGDLDFITTEERRNLGVIWWENPHNTNPGLLNRTISHVVSAGGTKAL